MSEPETLRYHFDDADKFTDTILGRVGKNIVLALPLGLGKANHVANSVFNRAAGDDVDRASHFHRFDPGKATREARTRAALP